MRTIINVPIEPLEERYSSQWDKWFRDAFSTTELVVHTVYGERSSGKINTGSFLDVFDTNEYKASQMQQIIELLRLDPYSSYTIFFHDLWFPGIQSLAYIRDGANMDIEIVGCLHAGSYDPYDFLCKKGMAHWAKDFENSLFKIVDKVFVATNFHKELLLKTREFESEGPIIVTGFPMVDDFTTGMSIGAKENIVVFPHRLDDEKQPQLFEKLARYLKGIYPGWQFIKSKDVCNTKEEYFELLAKSKIAISFAKQETWGIAMQEAVYFNCTPIVPNRLSYPEMYRKSFVYKVNEDEFKSAISHVKLYMRNWQEQEQSQLDWITVQKRILIKKNTEAMSNILNYLKG